MSRTLASASSGLSGLVDRRLSPIARSIVRRAVEAWQVGRLTIHLPDGAKFQVGRADAQPHATMWIDRYALFRRFALQGDLGAGESFMDGDWRADDLSTFLELAILNQSALPLDSLLTKLVNIGNTCLHRLRINSRRGSRRHIGQHYDLSDAFFALFLDESLTYSCALFEDEADTLAEAQKNKFRRLCDKLAVNTDDHLLEIGCGWGAFAMYAARHRGCRVTALTISQRQFDRASARVRQERLGDRVDVRLCDYRDVTGRFDKIVSIEMFEAVGREYWGRFFRTCDTVLAPGGLVGLQTIVVPDHRFAQYARHGDWIQKHIFPGGLLPSLGEICRAAMRETTLGVQHLEEIGSHYASTLACWRRAFAENLDAIRALGFGERFIRTWEFYLASCEAGFRTKLFGDLQLVLGRRNALPRG